MAVATFLTDRAQIRMSHHPPETRYDAPCGFCGLLCDDLSVTADHGRVRIDAGSCPRAAAAFDAANRHLEVGTTPLVKGKPVTLEQAIAYIVDDELVEVTPKSIRLRKQVLNPSFRKKRARVD